MPDITISTLASGTSHLVNMPASVATTDLLVASMALQDETITTPTGWTLLDQTANAAITRVGVFYKIADGTEGGTTVDFVTAGATKLVAHVWRYLAANWHGTTPPEVGTAWTSVGDTTAPDAPSVTASWGAETNHHIALWGCVNARTVTAYPTNYTNGNDDNTTGGGGSNVSIGSALRSVANVPEDPPTFTISASGRVVAETVVIRPAAAAASTGEPGVDMLLLGVPL